MSSFSRTVLVGLLGLSLSTSSVFAQNIFERTNRSACGVTTASVFSLDQNVFVSEIAVWSRWNGGESELSAMVYDQRGNVVASGPAVKATCDTYQSSWCEAMIKVGSNLGPGLYTVSMDEPRICINQGIESGFVRVAGGSAVSAPIPPIASTKPDAPTPSDDLTSASSVVDLKLRGRNSEQFSFNCPAELSLSTRVWGTGVYTDDSSICTAAVHAGIIGSGGGLVTLEVRPGMDSYTASSKNGVQSQNFADWSGSFTFVGGSSPLTPALPSPSDPGQSISSTTTVIDLSLNGQNGSRHALSCPSGSSSSSSNIWGTDTYTDDSSICKAAIHAGVLSNGGGSVTIEILEGMSSYSSSTRNGITSTAFGAWSGSFRFVR